MSRSRRGSRSWRRWTAEEARAELEAWRASGQALPRYCAERGLGYERVRRWRRKLEGHARAEALRPVRIVGAVERSEPPAALVVELADGCRIHLDASFDPEALGRVLAVLERA